MADYTIKNLMEVEDMAPKFGFAPDLESRFARKDLELEKSGLGYYRMAPNFRLPFGHTHSEQEEVYVVVAGTAHFKIEDEIVELGTWDALRVAATVSRGMEAGPEGAEILAFGAPNTDNKDAEMDQGFWPEG